MRDVLRRGGLVLSEELRVEIERKPLESEDKEGICNRGCASL